MPFLNALKIVVYKDQSIQILLRVSEIHFEFDTLQVSKLPYSM